MGKIFSFFEGMSSNHTLGAHTFVEQILAYGGLYPKLAQRLRSDKSIVVCEQLRHALGRVMQNCASRGEQDVVQLLLEQGVVHSDTQNVKYLKTLGTGSIAQTVLLDIDGTQRVMKMTWPSDERRFESDFEDFQVLRDRLEYGNDLVYILPRISQLSMFLEIVLSKCKEILDEFDLGAECENTRHGKMLFEKYGAYLTEYRAAAPCFCPDVPEPKQVLII